MVASQIDLHADFGGVVPELASRAHVETITPIIEQALDEAGVAGNDLDAVAVTSGPGLVGALLVGIATAKALALGWGVPVVGVNHLEGHLASVYLADRDVPFPQIALLVSGGHCMLTRAPSRAATSCSARRWTTPSARPTTRWPAISDSATRAVPCSTGWRRPARMCSAFPDRCSPTVMCSRSPGSRRPWSTTSAPNPGFSEAEVAASFVAACMDVLCAKLHRALDEFGDPAVAIVGGVAASPILRARAQALADEFGARLLIPPHSMATDNAAMIGVAGWPSSRPVRAEPAGLRTRARPSVALHLARHTRPGVCRGPSPPRRGARGHGPATRGRRTRAPHWRCPSSSTPWVHHVMVVQAREPSCPGRSYRPVSMEDVMDIGEGHVGTTREPTMSVPAHDLTSLGIARCSSGPALVMVCPTSSSTPMAIVVSQAICRTVAHSIKPARSTRRPDRSSRLSSTRAARGMGDDEIGLAGADPARSAGARNG